MRRILRTLYAAAANAADLAARIAPVATGDGTGGATRRGGAGGKLLESLRARRGLRERYRDWASQHRDTRRRLVWIHAPSVGEGLMARPVLTLLRARHPHLQLAYTFFSPSAVGFARHLDVDFADYLPFDSAAETSAALDALRPTALVFSKLDVWPELVRHASERGVRLGLISATLSEGSGRRHPLARELTRDAYAALDAVGAIDDADAERLRELGVRSDRMEITGDTRYDQVLERVSRIDRGAPLLSRFDDERPTIVAGSTWPSDEAVLMPAFKALQNERPGVRLIIAPHEPTGRHVGTIVSAARDASLRCALLDDADAATADVVVVDRVGVLADLYAVADLSYVGGGFHGAGLHSVVEPAALGIPVVFGPRHRDSRDALELLRARAGEAVTGPEDLGRKASALLGTSRGKEAGASARDLVERGRGAAERSVRLIERLLDSRADESSPSL